MPQLLMYIGGRGTNQIAGFVIKTLGCDWDTENSAPILNSVKTKNTGELLYQGLYRPYNYDIYVYFNINRPCELR
jgi:O-acetylhomoserine/O-acetylserine sulfhydrylase-like pyridoxal-dependent enzyme